VQVYGDPAILAYGRLGSSAVRQRDISRAHGIAERCRFPRPAVRSAPSKPEKSPAVLFSKPDSNLSRAAQRSHSHCGHFPPARLPPIENFFARKATCPRCRPVKLPHLSWKNELVLICIHGRKTLLGNRAAGLSGLPAVRCRSSRAKPSSIAARCGSAASSGSGAHAARRWRSSASDLLRRGALPDKV